MAPQRGRLKPGLPSRSSRAALARLRPFGLRRGILLARFRERRLVGLGRFELPTSRLSSARSNQLSYKPDEVQVAKSASGSRKFDGKEGKRRGRQGRQKSEDGNRKSEA